MALSLPSNGFVFWPVGCGDSTTVVVGDEALIQVDVHALEAADEVDDPRLPVLDELVDLLQVVDDFPYLPSFFLTHLDQDHCRGFKELLNRVTIGEIWVGAPALNPDHNLCDDAKSLVEEVERRIEAVRRGSIASGDRLVIVGGDVGLEPYADLPSEMRRNPGDVIAAIDGRDLGGQLRVTLLGPGDVSDETDRNDASLAAQLVVSSGLGSESRLVFMGDRAYPGVTDILDSFEREQVSWNVLLAPHHCSKSVFYQKVDGEDEPVFRQDVLDDLEVRALDPAWIVASCEAIPAADEPGDDPPHAEAKERYEEIAPDGFYATSESPSPAAPEPIVIEFDGDQLVVREAGTSDSRSQSVLAATRAARGSDEPPAQTVGFGSWL